MAQASDYAITQGYGYDPRYPLNGGQHRGVDYGCPDGTPVIVNGLTIGLSGHTGAAYGAHLHVGRWVNGQPTDPGRGGGFSLPGASVFAVGSDATNGNFVQVLSDGAVWCYLHLSKISVGRGQALNAPAPPPAPVTRTGDKPMTPDEERDAYAIVLERPMDGSPSGRRGIDFIRGAVAELQAKRNAREADKQAWVDNTNRGLARIGELNERIGELSLALQNAQAEGTANAETITKAQNRITELSTEIGVLHKQLDYAAAVPLPVPAPTAKSTKPSVNLLASLFDLFVKKKKA